MVVVGKDEFGFDIFNVDVFVGKVIKVCVDYGVLVFWFFKGKCAVGGECVDGSLEVVDFAL